MLLLLTFMIHPYDPLKHCCFPFPYPLHNVSRLWADMAQLFQVVESIHEEGGGGRGRGRKR